MSDTLKLQLAYSTIIGKSLKPVLVVREQDKIATYVIDPKAVRDLIIGDTHIKFWCTVNKIAQHIALPIEFTEDIVEEGQLNV